MAFMICWMIKIHIDNYENLELMETMPMVSKLKYGNTNTFFVRGTDGNLLIDTDYAGTLPNVVNLSL